MLCCELGRARVREPCVRAVPAVPRVRLVLQQRVQAGRRLLRPAERGGLPRARAAVRVR